jgi:hypothetical protein
VKRQKQTNELASRREKKRQARVREQLDFEIDPTGVAAAREGFERALEAYISVRKWGAVLDLERPWPLPPEEGKAYDRKSRETYNALLEALEDYAEIVSIGGVNPLRKLPKATSEEFAELLRFFRRAHERFLVLTDEPTGTGVGPYKFGKVVGYGVIAFADLAEARAFCNDQAGRFSRLRVVDRQTWHGKTIDVVYEVPRKS